MIGTEENPHTTKPRGAEVRVLNAVQHSSGPTTQISSSCKVQMWLDQILLTRYELDYRSVVSVESSGSWDFIHSSVWHDLISELGEDNEGMAISLWKRAFLSRNGAVQSFRRPRKFAPAFLRHSKMFRTPALRIMRTYISMWMTGQHRELLHGNNNITIGREWRGHISASTCIITGNTSP